MTPRHKPQPTDEWSFVPQDDEVETKPATPSPETAAMHVERRSTPARDAGRSDVELGEGPGAPEYLFRDEEPEDGIEEAVEPEGDTEPDLEEMLESQHYAFEPGEEAAP